MKKSLSAYSEATTNEQLERGEGGYGSTGK